MLFLYFPTHRGNKKSLLLFLFLAAYILSVWLIVCNTYVLQTWVLQITGKHFNKTDATIREVQDMSHLPPCPHTSVSLFLLSVILGLLAALPTQEWFPSPGPEWVQCRQWRRWAQPFVPLGQCSCKLADSELGLSPLDQSRQWAGDIPGKKTSCSALQRLLSLQFSPLALWPGQWGDLGFKMPLSSATSTNRARVYMEVFLIFHPFQQCCAWDSSHSKSYWQPPGPMTEVLSGSNDINWVMGTVPQREGTCRGITVPGPYLFPRPWLLALREERGAWRVAPALGEARTCTSNSSCHKEAERPFETQALEIKGSNGWYEIHLCLLSNSFLRQRPSSVNHLHVCVTVIIAMLNTNVKGYWAIGINQTLLACMYQTGLPLLCVHLSIMKAAMVSGKQLQELKSKPGVQIIFSHTDLAYPHIQSLLDGSVKIICEAREKGLLWQCFWGRNTERLRSVFTPFFIQNVWFLNKHREKVTLPRLPALLADLWTWVWCVVHMGSG